MTGGRRSGITGCVFSTYKYPAWLRPRLPECQRTSALTCGFRWSFPNRVGRLLSGGPAVIASSETTWQCRLPGEAEVDLAFDVGPFFGLSQPPHQFFKGRCVFGGELKPGQEVEGLFEVTPVVQSPRDRREVFKPGGDVM